jgi:GNAT superfamily N-acetyltransferase
MSEFVLSKFEDAVIKRIGLEDVEQVYELAVIGFGREIAFEPQHYEHQIKRFPEGQICVEYDGKIVGSSSSLIVNFEEYENQHTFAQICDKGFVRNHNPNGKNLYGIEVVVHPDYRQKKIAQMLYEVRKELCKELNLKSILIGGRIPHYHKYADEYSAEEYVEQVIAGKLYDPVLNFQKNNGFKLIEVMRNYMPADKESLMHATLMEWINPDHRE